MRDRHHLRPFLIPVALSLALVLGVTPAAPADDTPIVDSDGEPDPTATFTDELVVTEPETDPVEPTREVTPAEVVAMPGAGEDVLQTLRALPGVVSVDDWSSRLYVRGGRPEQNGIYLDGIPVFDPYRLFGLTSLFNPEIVEAVDFFPGGFDVRYGDRLSAVIDVRNRDGVTDRRLAGSANISLTNTNLVAEGGISERLPSSWLVAARRTYYDLIANATSDTDSRYPAFTDVQTRLTVEPARGHRLWLSAVAYDEGTDLAEDTDPTFGDEDDRIEAVDDQSGFILGVHGEHRFHQRVRLSWVASATRNEQVSDVLFREGETSFESTIDQALEGDVLALRSMAEIFLDDHTLELGFEAADSDNTVTFRFRTDDPRIPIPDTLLDFSEAQSFQRAGAFVQDVWQATPRLVLKAGVRWDRSTLAGDDTVSPRASARYHLNDRWEARAAWGRYTQFASYESLQGDGYFLDLRGIEALGLEPERATHALLGVSHRNPRGWTLTLDLYRKQLTDLLQSRTELETILVLDDDDIARPYVREEPTYVPENARRGIARGAELSLILLEGRDRPMYGMLSYAWGEAKSHDDGPWQWEDHDRRHTVTLLGGWHFADRWELGVRWRYATGFPFTPLTTIIRVVEDVDGDGIYDPEAGDWFTHQRDEPDEVVNSARLPAYHRLDLRLQYERSFARLDTTFYLDLINAYARSNVLGYTYNQDYTETETVEGMPILPSLGVKIGF